MPAIDDVPPLDDPAHNDMRSELARLVIANKYRLGIGRFADADIAAHIDDIACVVLARAATEGPRFAERFPWLVDAIARLQRGESAVKMNG